MASGDRVYIADKETLDATKEIAENIKAATDLINPTTAATFNRIGLGSDTGGSATQGTVSAKLNAIINHLLMYWTAARSAQLNSVYDDVLTIADNTAIDDESDIKGNLSQKIWAVYDSLHNLKADFDTGRFPLHLSSKTLSVSTNAASQTVLLDISGAGMLEYVYSDMGFSDAILTFEIDGQIIEFNTSKGADGTVNNYIGQYVYECGSLLSQILSDDATAEKIACFRPVHFKESLKITVLTSSAETRTFNVNYAQYE